MKEIAIDATTRLKQAVTNEREVKLRLKEENEQLKVIDLIKPHPESLTDSSNITLTFCPLSL